LDGWAPIWMLISWGSGDDMPTLRATQNLNR
jgi:hypothetical protein